MKIVKIGSEPPSDIVYIQCDCGLLIKHLARKWRVTCGCGRTELLKAIRKDKAK